MFGKSFRWDYDYKDPEEWINWMSSDKIDCDHYFIELAAEYLNRRILIYPLFENEVKSLHILVVLTSQGWMASICS